MVGSAMEHDASRVPRRRYDTVQALRFVAATLVVVTHGTLYTSRHLDKDLPVWHFGEIGVDLFFTISGFVMYSSSVPHLGKPSYWKTFVARRLVRIVPMYWLGTTAMLLAVAVAPQFAAPGEVSPWRVFASYFFLPSTNPAGRVEPILGVGWTLTFEMFFYAVFALALRARWNVAWTSAAVMGVLSVGALAGRPPVAALVVMNPVVLYFVAGIFIAKASAARSLRAGAPGLALVGALWLVIDMLGTPHWNVAALARQLGVCAVVAAVVALDPWLAPRVPRLATWWGDASYSIYLFHPLVGPVVPLGLAAVGVRSPALAVLGVVTLSVGVCSAIYMAVERPLTAWLRRFVPRTGPPDRAEDRTPGPRP